MKAKAQSEHEDGLLEYLEDIIGTTRYKQPIEEASAEVEVLNEQRQEKMNRLRVVEREKAALEVRTDAPHSFNTTYFDEGLWLMHRTKSVKPRSTFASKTN
jgi:chromosome segregation ATPase